MGKTIWINGTDRYIGDKNRYGLYEIGIDDKDVEWLNSLKHSLNNDFKKPCPKCNGRGYFGLDSKIFKGKPCRRCKGQGFIKS